jgi:sortase A
MTARHTTSPPRRVPPGRAFALIQSPTIDVERVVAEGVGRDELRKGPGHMPSTLLPGQPGTVAVSGHRTTYGAPFYRLDELRNGDQILLVTRGWTDVSTARCTQIVRPTDSWVLDDVPGPGGKPNSTITLTPAIPLLGPPAADRVRRPHRQHPQARRSGCRGGPVSARSGADAANW